ncbi:hypothetical protein, partial [Kitasatospora sp. NPDC097691]|uniref:hypothetical protein n=1 Tax=Kitasatospora sp. NPDC097691 TaxID=3157231 RepID=UPI0033168FF0
MDQERMELAYAPTDEDFREAIAAHARHTTVGRVVRVAVWVPAAFAALGCAAPRGGGLAPADREDRRGPRRGRGRGRRGAGEAP